MRTVGRIYLEDVSGPLGRVQAEYGVHPRVREPQVRYQGRVYVQAVELPEGWVYRTIEAARGGETDADLTGFCSEGEAGFVRPSDWPPVVDQAEAARVQFEAGLQALRAHPQHAELVAAMTAAMAEGPADE